MDPTPQHTLPDYHTVLTDIADAILAQMQALNPYRDNTRQVTIASYLLAEAFKQIEEARRMAAETGKTKGTLTVCLPGAPDSAADLHMETIVASTNEPDPDNPGFLITRKRCLGCHKELSYSMPYWTHVEAPEPLHIEDCEMPSSRVRRNGEDKPCN